MSLDIACNCIDYCFLHFKGRNNFKNKSFQKIKHLKTDTIRKSEIRKIFF